MTTKSRRGFLAAVFLGLPLAVFVIGFTLQMAVLAANKFVMPVDVGDCYACEYDLRKNPDRTTFFFKKHQVMSDSTRLNLLGDRFRFEFNEGLVIYSIGDVMLVLGALGYDVGILVIVAIDLYSSISKERNCED